SPELGWGTLEIVRSGDAAVFVHSLTADTGRFIGVHSFSAEARVVTIPLRNTQHQLKTQRASPAREAPSGVCVDLSGEAVVYGAHDAQPAVSVG
ncbi:hypothetical protein ACC691_38540, partial [Rhizobium johnstonii]|uniref:hypothetical protein n=1 Tax=Rhizobium johnstonii TaxID=3019933 RepID=UPI003F9A4950